MCVEARGPITYPLNEVVGMIRLSVHVVVKNDEFRAGPMKRRWAAEEKAICRSTEAKISTQLQDSVEASENKKLEEKDKLISRDKDSSQQEMACLEAIEGWLDDKTTQHHSELGATR